MSRPELARATGISTRTIQRIENGETGNDVTISALEAYFALDRIDPDTESEQPRPAQDPQLEDISTAELLAAARNRGARVSLEDYTLMELLAEAVRRVAQVEARTPGEHFVGDPVRVRWSTADVVPERRANSADERGIK